MDMSGKSDGAVDDRERPSLLSLCGIGKEVFASLGGAEAFIRNEREHFYSSPDRDPLLWDEGTTDNLLE
jgi:hypothetical protein